MPVVTVRDGDGQCKAVRFCLFVHQQIHIRNPFFTKNIIQEVSSYAKLTSGKGQTTVKGILSALNEQHLS